jgi:hypothetical protein
MSRYSKQDRGPSTNAGSNRGLNTTRLVNVGTNGSFPKQGKDYSTLGKPSNYNSYASQTFQKSALGQNDLSAEKSALTNGTFRPVTPGAIAEEFVGSSYGTPNDAPPATFYLLAECGDIDRFIFVTEENCNTVDQIQWLTTCDL